MPNLEAYQQELAVKRRVALDFADLSYDVLEQFYAEEDESDEQSQSERG